LGQWIERGFDEEEDFGDFIVLMLEVNHKAPLRVIGYCLMTNHFHLVLWPKK
jgi:putative transposase